MKISVIIPNHNYEIYIKDAINSIIKQDYCVNQIVIVDDGSTDSSWQIIQNYIENYSDSDLISNIKNNIKITAIKLDKPHGPSYARNVGIKYVWNETDIYAFLDADDMYHQNKISKSIPFFKDNNIGMVYSDYSTYNTNTKLLLREFKEPYSRNRLLQECIINNDSLVSKLALEKAGLYDEDMRVAEDYDLWIRVSEHFLCVHIPESLITIRITGKGATFSVSKEKWNTDWSRIREKMKQRYGQ